MKKLDYKKLNTFIASDIIQPFYKIRIDRLAGVKLSDVVKRKNPYLFKAKTLKRPVIWQRIFLMHFFLHKKKPSLVI